MEFSLAPPGGQSLGQRTSITSPAQVVSSDQVGFMSQWFHRVTSHQDSLGDLVRVGAELQLFLPLLVWSSD